MRHLELVRAGLRQLVQHLNQGQRRQAGMRLRLLIPQLVLHLHLPLHHLLLDHHGTDQTHKQLAQALLQRTAGRRPEKRLERRRKNVKGRKTQRDEERKPRRSGRDKEKGMQGSVWSAKRRGRLRKLRRQNKR